MASLSIGRPPKGVNVSSLLDDSPTAAEDNEASGSQELQQDSIDEAEESFCVVEEETDRFVINEGRVDYEDEVGTSGIGENLIMKTESEDSSEPIDYSITASHEGTNSPFLGIECTVCHKMLRNERTMTEHMRLHTGERPFACTDCNAAFISMDALRRHRYSVHLDIRPERPGPVFCSVCQKELANDRTLKEHMRMHTGERPYPCDQCDMSFMALDRLRRHQKTDHLGERPDPLECPICFKELSNGHSLRRHMLVHTGERNFTCEECGKVFRTATDLNVHSKIHTGERPYKCEMCGGGYIKPSDLAKHMKRKHPEVITGDDDDDSDETTGDSIFDPIMNLDAKAALALFDGTVTAPNGFECPFCKREMANQRNLTEHMRTHTGEKPFSCDKCDATFMSADRLRRHKKNIHSKEKRIPTDLVDCPICTKKFPKRKMDDHIRSHTGERPFPCEECGVAFATYESLRRHLKSSIHVDEPKPRLDCPICHKDLASKRTLQEHMRTHTGEKPYLCTECGARFASKDSIRRHRRVHTGERPYECQECGKVFRDHTALKVHKTTHTGERPHPCEECEKRFLTRTQLSNHTKRCHPTLMSLEKTNAADASEETTQDSNLDSEVMPYPVEENEPSSSSLLEPEMEPLIGTKEEETDRLVIIGGRVSYEDEAGPSGVADFQRQHSGITINHEESSPFFFQSGGVEFTPQESSPMPQGPMEELLCYPKEEETDRLVIRGGRVSYEEDAGSSGIEEELLPELETKPPSGLLNGDVSVAAHQLFPQPINESITGSPDV